MATTSRQDNDFADALIPGRDNLLEEAIEWIKDNLSVDQVFEEAEMVSWAEEHGYVKE